MIGFILAIRLNFIKDGVACIWLKLSSWSINSVLPSKKKITIDIILIFNLFCSTFADTILIILIILIIPRGLLWVDNALVFETFKKLCL